jgi:hypothetical protein
MNKNALYFFLSVLFTLHASYSAEIIDSLFSIKFNIEDQWNYDSLDSNTRYIYDLSKTFKSYIYIEKILLDKSIVLKDDEYAQLLFHTNLSVAKKFGTVQYYDTSNSMRQGDLRAYELFAFYYKDTSNGGRISWAELGRWCKKGNYIFQITVLGDTTDLLNNLTKYKNVVNLITIIPNQSNIKIHFKQLNIIKHTVDKRVGYTSLDGRQIKPLELKSRPKLSNGIYISGNQRIVIFLSQ